MEQLGYSVEVEVSIMTPLGRRGVDIVVSKDGVTVGHIETKTGRSRYLTSQREKDEWIRANMGPATVVVRPGEGS